MKHNVDIFVNTESEVFSEFLYKVCLVLNNINISYQINGVKMQQSIS